MRKSFMVSIVAASALVSYAAFAADQTPPPAPGTNVTTSTSSDDNQMVCRQEKLTGTLLPGPRVCKPLKIWRQQQQDSSDLLNHLTNGNLQSNPPGG